MLPDLVWFTRPGENEELRHSLRSITANLPHRDVWVIGEPPDWYTGYTIANPGIRGTTSPGRFAAVQRALRIACTNGRISDPFVACDDDMYLLQPLPKLGAYHRGRLRDFHSAPPYDTRAHDAATLLETAGITNPLNYDLHLPHLVHKTSMLKALDMAAGQPTDTWVWSLYGNLAHLGGTLTSDPKAYGTHATHIEHEPGQDNTGPWLSTDDRSWESAAGTLIRATFPNPCSHEDPTQSPTRIDVLSLNAGADTGGISWGLLQAFRHDPLIHFGSAMLSDNYIEYPSAGRVIWDDTDRPYEYPGVYADWCRAQVLHLHNNLRTRDIMISRGQPDRPFALNHHGTEFRENYAAMNAEVESLGGVGMVSTVDMLDLGTGLTWVPAPYNIPALAAMRNTQHNGRLRVGHFPTNRAIKSTEAIIAACEKLDVELILLENASWARCLEIKATCDLYIDQFQLGYGCNAIEAWGMSIPVIAGATPRTLEIMHSVFGPDLPFYEAEETSIGDAIRALMDDTTRNEYADRGHHHAQRFHSGTYARATLKPIYAALAAHTAPPKPQRAPTAQALPDLIIRVGQPSGELRHTIRSLDKNIPHARLYTAGTQTPWLTCPHIPVTQRDNEHASAYAILRAILACDELTPNVIIADDDMYALHMFDTLPAHHCGPLANLPARARAQAITDTLTLTTPDVLCRDLHLPHLVNRARLTAQLDAINLPPERIEHVLWQTLHGGGDPTYHPDAKIRRPDAPWPSNDWLSTNDASYQGPVQIHLRRLFPTPSPWETNPPTNPNTGTSHRCAHHGCRANLPDDQPVCPTH